MVRDPAAGKESVDDLRLGGVEVGQLPDKGGRKRNPSRHLGQRCRPVELIDEGGLVRHGSVLQQGEVRGVVLEADTAPTEGERDSNGCKV